MKKLIVIFTLLIISLISVHAEAIDVTLEALNKDIYPGTTASYQITVKNNQNADDTFLLIPDEFASIPFSDVFEYIDAEPSSLDIKAGDSKTALITVKTLKQIAPNKNYRTYVTVKSLRNNIVKKIDIVVSIIAPEESIKVSSNLPDSLIPGRDVSFQVDIENALNKILDNVEVYIISDLYKDTERLKLFPFQEVKKDITFNLPSNAKKGDYTFEVKVYQDRKLAGRYTKQFNVKANPDIDESIETTSGFLVKTVSIIRTNIGNEASEERYLLPTSKFQKSFMSFKIQPSRESDTEIEWLFTLEPGETYTIEVRTDYRSLFITIILVFIVASVLIYFATRKVAIRKEAFKIKADKGISELKILIHVKNRTKKSLKDITVIDYLPNLIKPTKEFGTLKPDSIQKGSRYIKVLWHVPELVKGEERIISYKGVTTLHVVGKLTLPKGEVKYNVGKKMYTHKSNTVVLFSLKEKED